MHIDVACICASCMNLLEASRDIMMVFIFFIFFGMASIYMGHKSNGVIVDTGWIQGGISHIKNDAHSMHERLLKVTLFLVNSASATATDNYFRALFRPYIIFCLQSNPISPDWYKVNNTQGNMIATPEINGFHETKLAHMINHRWQELLLKKQQD
ncbi:hypothetical protein ACJX0J_025981 [Zea mays]